MTQRDPNDFARCRHCGDPIEYADFGAWVDENGLRSCAPLALRHEPEHPEPLPRGVVEAEHAADCPASRGVWRCICGSNAPPANV